jgi:predicted outer membrane repeat protein
VWAGGPWYVSPAGDNSTCDSWSTACASINGAKGKASSGDTIYIGPGLYTETLSISGSSLQALTLVGAGAVSTTIDGGLTGNKAVNVYSAAAVTITGVTIQHANGNQGGCVGASGNSLLRLDDVVISECYAGTSGGAIYNSDSTLALSDSLIISNTAGSSGGGISNVNDDSIATIINSTIISNSAGSQGGAIYSVAPITLVNTLVASNTANAGGGIYKSNYLALEGASIVNNTANTQRGGGIHSWYGPVQATGGVIANNRAQASDGGGIHIEDGELLLSDTTIRNNVASGLGGGIHSTIGATTTLVGCTLSYNNAGSRGGGVYVSNMAGLTNVTLSGNHADADGGGLYSHNASVSLLNCTVASNGADCDRDESGDGGGLAYSGSTIVITNTIVASNHDGSGGTEHRDCSALSGGGLTSGDHNFVGNNTGCNMVAQGNDQVGTGTTHLNPQIGVLQDNGGPTYTRALLEGSPAIDAGGDVGCPARDQRGVPRLSPCDIGAYEYALQVFLPLVVRNY